MSNPYESIRKETAFINAAADEISALEIGDSVSVWRYRGFDAYTIIDKKPKVITLDEDCPFARKFPEAFRIKISLRFWTDEEGKERRKWKRESFTVQGQRGNVYIGKISD